MKFLCLILSLVLLSSAAIAGQLTPTTQMVITEYGGTSKNSYTLNVTFLPVVLGGTSEACKKLATRISFHVNGYDSTTINDWQLARSAIDYLCIHQNGSIAGSGRIYQIPWNGKTMCLEYGTWSGITIKEECRVFDSRPLVLGLEDSLNEYVKEWQ